jgi:hypothetical protein
MFYPITIKLVPQYVRTLDTFTAADPWKGAGSSQFTLNAYQLVPAVNPTMRVDPNANVQNCVLGLRTASDESAERPLPEGLSELWRRKGIRTEQLPAALKKIEPQLKDGDYRLHLDSRQNLMLKIFAWFGGAAFVAIGALGLLIPDPGFPAGVFFAVSALLALVTVGGLLGFQAGRRNQRLRQMEHFRALCSSL